MQIISLGSLPSGERIEWYVVEQNEEEIILLSCKGLINKPFTLQFRRSTYDNSDLKKWLENNFASDCLPSEAKVFCQSIGIPNANAIKTWLPTESTRRCSPSKYAMTNGAATFKCVDGFEMCAYWLADSGRKEGYSTSIVLGNGKIYKSAYNGSNNICVRVVVSFQKEWLNEYIRNHSW